MLLWILIALLTAAAILAVLLPLGRTPPSAGGEADARRVYREQLKELERDRTEGRISAAEAESVRAEIARRLLAADAAPGPVEAIPDPTARRATAVGALVGIPLLSISLYLGLGAPNLPGAPLAARLEQLPVPDDVEGLLARVEAHLASDPEDGRGWDVIAPVYLRLGRADEAIRAYRNAIRLLGSTAERQSGLAEAILTTEAGIVTEDARRAFEAANALDPDAPGPRFFLALAAEQEGKFDEAAGGWRALLEDAPADASWRPAVEQALARVAGHVADGAEVMSGGQETEPAPTEEETAAVQSLPPDEQSAMIEGMVSRLADRLRDEPDDVEGWLRLIRSYAVLGRAEAAVAAARDALAGLSDAEERERVEALAAELGMTPAEIGRP